MKNAIAIIVFQMFVVAVYFAAPDVVQPNITGTPQPVPMTVTGYDMSIDLGASDRVSVRGSRMEEHQDTVRFFDPDGELLGKGRKTPVKFSGREGELTPDRSFIINGDVRVESGQSVFTGSRITYDRTSGTINSVGAARIIYDSMIVEGSNLVLRPGGDGLGMQNVRGKIWY